MLEGPLGTPPGSHSEEPGKILPRLWSGKGKITILNTHRIFFLIKGYSLGEMMLADLITPGGRTFL